MTELSKSTQDSILIWLTYTTVNAPCGRKRIVRRLVEWDPETKKILYVFPPEHKRAVPEDGHLLGREYLRPHQINPNPLRTKEFMEAARAIGIIPPGMKIT